MMDRLWRGIAARARLAGSFAVVLLVLALLPESLTLTTRLLLAWDTGVLLYLLTTGFAMRRAEADDIRRHARQQDEGRSAVLVLTALAIAVSFGAIAAELQGTDTKGAHGFELALAAVTILLSWLMTQVTMAVHYAGEFYGHSDAEGGLGFPGGHDTDPDYLDFLYFSFTMGAAAQTSDVAVTSRGMRALVLAHTILAFLFNTAVLALAVNVGASLI